MYESLTKLLGEATVERVRSAKVVLVGAGGIGCELLKELVLAGFGEIHLIDLDTIDLSNLNRQFLFTKQHVKQSKSRVAAEVALRFNPEVRIVPYVANVITSPEFDHKWFKSMDLVFNALDNAEARRHVNRMCVAANTPLIDCGTAGLHGQVQVVVPYKSECYDCHTHDAPKTFPVCTIRSTPSQPIHCVVWAKSFLFTLLFAPEEEGEPIEEATEENKNEIEKLNAEANELVDLRRSLRQPDFLSKLVGKVYVADIERLLLSGELWKNSANQKPKQLDMDPKDYAEIDSSTLDDHKIWTPEECMGVLKSSVAKLVARLEAGEPAIEFDKDDEDTLDFVVAATGLRSLIFGIPQRSKFEIKQMAGNIIPAVATTNAIVGGLGVLEAFKLLGGMERHLRSVNILRHQDSVLVGDRLYPPNPGCDVSQATRITATAPPTTKLADFIATALQEQLGYEEVSITTDKLIYDPDFEDEAVKTLAELNMVDRFFTVADEDDRRVDIELYVEPGDEVKVHETRVPLKPEVKRPREEDDDEEALNGENGEIEIESDIEVLD